MSYENMSMEDVENYRSSELSIKEIALEQYRRCCKEGSKEMARGGRTTNIFKGIPMEVDMPNQRDVFFRAVLMMEVILTPHYANYKELREEMINLTDKIGITKKFVVEEFKKYKNANKGKKINWDDMKDVLKDECETALVQISTDKLIVLSELLRRINYFSEGSNEISLEGFNNEE